MSNRDPIESSWRGLKRWECPVEGCAFDTLDFSKIIDHVNWAHGTQPDATDNTVPALAPVHELDEDAITPGSADDVPDPMQLTRDELNALAARHGVSAPESLPNKAAVVDALNEAQGTVQGTTETAPPDAETPPDDVTPEEDSTDGAS